MTLFIIIWSAWFLSEIVLNIFFRSDYYHDNPDDKRSIRIIWVTIALAITLGVVLRNHLKFPGGISSCLSHAGLLLILSGMLVRFLAVFSLGKYFTVDVSVSKDHVLKKDGIYRIVRHPSYLGMLLSFAGFGVSLDSFVSIFVVFIPVTASLIFRIKIEEDVLKRHFGADYIEYSKKTFRLLPYVY